MSPNRDALAAETIARHFPEARLKDAEVDLGFGGLRIECKVARIHEVGRYRSASLFFHLSGGALGTKPVFASVSGYAETAEAAIVAGGCNWACSFGPLLRAGLAQEEQPEVDRFELSIDGQRRRVFVEGLDRVLASGGEPDVARTAAARTRLGAAPWLARRVLESGRLPVLPAGRPTVLSVFIASAPPGLTVEVKVNGCDWPGMDEVFADTPAEPEGATTLLRELAIVAPLSGPAPLTRDMVVRTLTGLSREIGGRLRDAVRWPGWRHHGGRLAAPLTEIDLARLEREVGPLPSDYRQFLLEVAGAGAGPGYGLLSPAGAAQRQLARGTFSWQDGESADRPPAGVLALAHGGCGIMWLLVLRGPGCGEVWCDAISSDGKVRRVSESFAAWYRDWIDSAVSDSGPWCSWDGLSCATASVLVQLLESVEKEGPPPDPAAPRLTGRVAPGKLSLLSGGGPYFPAKAPLHPCHSCVAICENQGLTDEVFAEGVRPGPGGDEPPDGPAGGLVGRWARKLGWGKS